ncbi:MAG: class I mannose-6-phosphate isomerase [Candidatus Nanopelagicales bacterium]
MNVTSAILLPVNQFDHFYRGGDRIGALRHGPGGPRRPEEWIGSTTARFGQAPAGLTVLPDGKALAEEVSANPEGWLGPAHVARYGPSTELLVKLLDLDQRLPVHLHPTRAFSRAHLGLAHGKTEAWYVLDAPEGARVGVGVAQPMSIEQVRSWVMNRDSDALLSALRTREVRPGDAMLVPSGLPHTVQDGVFVLELQEPTDLSILLEWQGFAVDGFKDGHLDLGFDTALQAVDTSAISETDLDRLVLPREDIESGGLVRALPTAADPYFRLHRLTGSTGESMAAGFSIVLITGGRGDLAFGNHGQEVARGDAVLIPYAAGAWRLEGDVVAMVCRPPAADAPEAPR